MLKRGSSSKSYSPYATSQRVKKSNSKNKLDILPNRPNVWLKQVGFLLKTTVNVCTLLLKNIHVSCNKLLWQRLYIALPHRDKSSNF